MSKTRINRKRKNNLCVSTISTPSHKEHHITALPSQDCSQYSILEDIAEFVRKENATVLRQLVFGDSCHHRECIEHQVDTFGPVTWPIMWLQGDSCSCGCWTGTQLVALSGVQIDPLIVDGVLMGYTYEGANARYCELGNVFAVDTSASGGDQARSVYERILSALNNAGMGLENVVRMWNYLDHLLQWYDEFNVARTEFYDKHHVFDHIVPASTGIGAANTNASAHVGSLVAIQPKNGAVRIRPVPSPLQCPALDYKSSFSRAVEVAFPDYRHLYISGTASIDPQGKTIHVGDISKQIERTMDVVKAILNSRHMGWENATRGIAYFKNLEDAHLLQSWTETAGIPPIPLAISHADICRDDLLFEIELDAVMNE